jgi:hypothetical protein
MPYNRTSYVQRDDLDAQTPGQAVIRKLLIAAGSALTLTSTGIDLGTGDVTLGLNTSLLGTTTDAWNGVYHSNMSNGDPISMLRDWTMNSVAGPTPTNIGSTVARVVKLRNPATITVTKIHLFGVATVTALYRFAIYDATTLVRLWDSGNVTSAANAWLSITTGLPLILTGGSNYWFAVTTPSTGTVAAFRSPHAPVGTAFWGGPTTPLGTTSVGFPVFAQFAVTAGAFPVTMPALAAAAYAGGTTGTVPFAILSSV